MDIISSRTNSGVKEARKLQQKKYREASGTYLIEGFHLLEEALKSGAEICQIWLEAGFEEKAKALGLTNFTLVTASVLKFLSETANPQGVVAAIKKPQEKWSFSLKGNKFLILENVQDPGNVGTLIRTADAAAFDAVLTVGATADIYSGKVMRAMQGSNFHLPVMDFMGTYESLKNQGLSVLTSTLSADSVNYRSVQLDKFALIMGNEGNGVSEVAQKAADIKIHIPMPGQAESLNVAVAGGILMFQL